MNAEKKCNRCENFGPNGLAPYPCKLVGSRTCQFFSPIPKKKYEEILKKRVEKIKENEALRQQMLADQDLVDQVKEQTKDLMK